ncbi:MAG: hypothetical protein KF902_13875 [Phycisphaeraceae bacterium]|nr:hypothetical protein [Phycisphaeraceae bacterium]
MSNGATSSSTAVNPAGAGADIASLDEILVALQKSFSRLSASSREVSPENARAMITGTVQFELTAKFTVSKSSAAGPYDPPDVLMHRDDGSLDLKLSGTLETDTRVRVVSEERA